MDGAGPGADDMQVLMRLLGGAPLPDPAAVWCIPVRAHPAAPPSREADDAAAAGDSALAPEVREADGGCGGGGGGDPPSAQDCSEGAAEEAPARNISPEDELVAGAIARSATSDCEGGLHAQVLTGLVSSVEGAAPFAGVAVPECARSSRGEVASLNAGEALATGEGTMPSQPRSLGIDPSGAGSGQASASVRPKRFGKCADDVPAMDSGRSGASESSVSAPGEETVLTVAASGAEALSTPESESLSIDAGLGPAPRHVVSAANMDAPEFVAGPLTRVRYSRQQLLALRGCAYPSFDASQLSAESLLARDRLADAALCNRRRYSRADFMDLRELSLSGSADSENILPLELAKSPCDGSSLQSTARALERPGSEIASQSMQGGAYIDGPSSGDPHARTAAIPPILAKSDEMSALTGLPCAKGDSSAPSLEVSAVLSDGQVIGQEDGIDLELLEKGGVLRLQHSSREGAQSPRTAVSDGQVIGQEDGIDLELSEKGGVSRLPCCREGPQSPLTKGPLDLILESALPDARRRYSRDEMLALEGETCPEFDISGLPVFLRKHGSATSDVGRVVGTDLPLEVVQNRPDVALAVTDANVTFEEMLLPPSLLSGLHSAAYYVPSPVQARGLPVGRLGVDLIAQAKSGTGKTLVFAVLALETYIMASQGAPQISVLVLTPTRDIAAQVRDVMEQIAVKIVPRPRIGLLIGGTSVKADEKALREHAYNIIIGTPGRVEHMLESDSLNLSALKLLVLDEVDRTLDGSFEGAVPAICERLPASKQVLTFSATYSAVLLNTLRSVMRSPQFINLCETSTHYSDRRQNCPSPPELSSCQDRNEAAVLLAVRQIALGIPVPVVGHARGRTDLDNIAPLSVMAKLEELVALLSSQPFGQAVVFTNDKVNGCILKARLYDAGFAAVYMSGSELQSVRRTSMEAMRSGRARVLVSTDLVARGVDLPGCDFVVHLDLPQDSATYLHRVGRAGRFGLKGASVILHWDSGEERRHVEHLQQELRVVFEVRTALVSREPSEDVESGHGKVRGRCDEGAPHQDSLQATSIQELVSPPSDEDRGHKKKASHFSCGEESASSEEILLRDSSELETEYLSPLCMESLGAENDETPSERPLAPEDVAIHGQESIGESGSAAASHLPTASNHDDDWSKYAESAFDRGYTDGYRMAFRMATALSKRLGTNGIL